MVFDVLFTGYTRGVAEAYSDVVWQAAAKRVFL